MTWTEALEEMIRRTGHTRYRELCADSWPDHAAYRALMIRLATGQAPEAAPAADDAALRAYVAAHPCGGC